jgi:predicted aspartyl protease
MGTFSVPIEIGDEQGQRWELVTAFVDTGSTFTVVPRSLLKRLGVRRRRRGVFRLGDEREAEYDVGATYVRIDTQEWPALVIFGDDDAEPLLGAHTLEAFLLAVDPVEKRLVPVKGLLL